MDVLHRLSRATVAQVREELPSAPSYSAVRALLGILERKGHVRHITDGPRYLYLPMAARSVERRSALRDVVRTFFGGSIEDAVIALVESSDAKLTAKQLEDLASRIAAAKKEGR